MTEAREFFTASEAADYLRYSPTTLAIWRSLGKGPAYLKIGHSVRYRREDLHAWASQDEATRRHIVATAECHRVRREKAKRARGRAGVAQRQRRLNAEPHCRDCAAIGVPSKAWDVDHIVPLTLGGLDTDNNVRSLCRTCHAARTRELRNHNKIREG